MKLIQIFITLSLVYSLHASEKSRVIHGKVLDESSREPLSGATIKIPSSKKGTYANIRGIFRLPVPEGLSELKVRSLGYLEKTVNLNSSDSITIVLAPDPLVLRGVSVAGEIEVEEIIRRAIKKKNENRDKINTFKGQLYSKMVLELGGSVFKSEESSALDELGPERVGNEYQYLVTETFSDVYIDYKQEKRRTIILQRRQTANMNPDDNILSLGTFVDFGSNELTFVDARFTPPLADDALDYYKYELIEKIPYGDRYVYSINVIPNSKIFPLFKGTMNIIEGTYNLIKVDLVPSESTTISLVDSLSFSQKFEPFDNETWYPVYLEVLGKIRVDVISGIIDFNLDLKSTNIYNDIEINPEIPDTMFRELPLLVSVEKDADSTKSEFWEQNSLREITETEQQYYEKVDSLVSIKKDSSIIPSSFSWDFSPYIDFNRTGSFTGGLSPEFSYGAFTLDGTAAYSFGLRDPIGEAGFNINGMLLANIPFNLEYRFFSQISTAGTREPYPRLFTSVLAGLFHCDYYDYFREDGQKLSISYSLDNYNLIASFKNTRHFDIGLNTDRSIFKEERFRRNPPVLEDDFTIYGLEIKRPRMVVISSASSARIGFGLKGKYGEHSSGDFKLLEGMFEASLPTFGTGYEPMELSFRTEGGISDNLPPQYLFRMESPAVFIEANGSFLTMEPQEFAGDSYYGFYFMHDFGDYFWRLTGLPAISEGRGLSLAARYSTGKIFGNYKPFFKSTGNEFYQEAGFRIGRIPTFISNFIFLQFDAAWGTGNFSAGRFGWSMSVDAPLAR